MRRKDLLSTEIEPGVEIARTFAATLHDEDACGDDPKSQRHAGEDGRQSEGPED